MKCFTWNVWFGSLFKLIFGSVDSREKWHGYRSGRLNNRHIWAVQWLNRTRYWFFNQHQALAPLTLLVLRYGFFGVTLMWRINQTWELEATSLLYREHHPIGNGNYYYVFLWSLIFKRHFNQNFTISFKYYISYTQKLKGLHLPKYKCGFIWRNDGINIVAVQWNLLLII